MTKRPLPSPVSSGHRRTQLSSPSPTQRGHFTRSRSQALLHRTRSGRVRLPTTTARPPKSIDEDEACALPVIDQTTHLPIKDLRSHRVFSAAPNSNTAAIAATICLPEHDKEEGVEMEDASLLSVAQQAEEDDARVESTSPDVVLPCPVEEAVTNAAVGAAGGEEGGCVEQVEDKEPIATNPMHRTPVLVPCSRLKVFSNPGSHCYRRLLPFLMDLTKNNSGKLEIVPTKNQSKWIENGAPRPLALPPHSVSQANDVHEAASAEHQNTEDAIVEVPVMKPLQVVAPPQITSRYPPDDSTCEFELLHEAKEIVPSVLREDLTVDELVGSMKIDPESCNKAKESYLEDVKHLPAMEHSQALGNGVSNVRSILKRSRGGCKGPCMCLDCASFRLNSERAFEFSKRQMLETKDVTLGLMKELSGLRKLVASSVVPIAGKEGYAVLQLNQLQVGDVCRRALEAETAARNRLREMASDLNVHCRITRYMQHKVTFADCKEPDNLG